MNSHSSVIHNGKKKKKKTAGLGEPKRTHQLTSGWTNYKSIQELLPHNKKEEIAVIHNNTDESQECYAEAEKVQKKFLLYDAMYTKF
jgi:hypothetical protein